MFTHDYEVECKFLRKQEFRVWLLQPKEILKIRDQQGAKGGAWMGGVWNRQISGPEIESSGPEICHGSPPPETSAREHNQNLLESDDDDNNIETARVC